MLSNTNPTKYGYDSVRCWRCSYFQQLQVRHPCRTKSRTAVFYMSLTVYPIYNHILVYRLIIDDNIRSHCTLTWQSSGETSCHSPDTVITILPFYLVDWNLWIYHWMHIKWQWYIVNVCEWQLVSPLLCQVRVQWDRMLSSIINLYTKMWL
jgi:hypothetical protein